MNILTKNMMVMSDTFNVVNQKDYSAKALSDEVLDSLYSGIGQQMLVEPTSLDDMVKTHMLDAITCDDNLLSAIVTRRSRLERTMRALIKSLNSSLTGTELIAGASAVSGIAKVQGRIVGDAIISKPRKLGLVAVMAAEIPVSDGQSVFIFFHAPDDNPAVIEQDDTLIAFKFMLNKRDITHVVSPHQGRDISLKQTTQSIANVIERNSEKFMASKASALASKAKLESIQESIESTIEETDKLIEENTNQESKLPELESEQSTVDLALQKQNKLNDELSAQVEAKESQRAKEKSEADELAAQNIIDNEAAEQQRLSSDISIERVEGGIYFADANKSQEQLSMWDGLKKGDKVFNHMNIPMGNVVRKSTVKSDVITLLVEGGYERKIDSVKVTGTSIKKLRNFSEQGMQKNDDNLAREKESKSKVLVLDDTFYEGDSSYQLTHINLDDNEVEITVNGVMIVVVPSSQLLEDYGVRVAGINAPIANQNIINEPESSEQETVEAAGAIVDSEVVDQGAENFKQAIADIGNEMIEALKQEPSKERMPLTNIFKNKLKSMLDELNNDEQKRLNAQGIVYAIVSKFMNTAIHELQNAGFIAPEIDINNLQGQSSAETPVEESVVETPVEEPVVETPVEEPVVETPVEDASSSIDPELVSIQMDIDQMEASRDNMKAANRATQKYNRNVAKDAEKALTQLENDFVALGYSAATAQQVATNPNYMGKVVAFESFSLTNLGARIKSRKAKLEEAKSRLANAVQGDEEYDLTINGFSATVEVNYDDDRVRVYFHGLSGRAVESDPEYEYFNKIKRGFNWSPYNGAWQRKITENARYNTATSLGFDNWTALKAAAVKPAESNVIEDDNEPSVDSINNPPVDTINNPEISTNENAEPEQQVVNNGNEDSTATDIIVTATDELKESIKSATTPEELTTKLEEVVTIVQGADLVDEYNPLFDEATTRILELLEA